MAKSKVVIVGAGVSGLICALELEKNGIDSVIVDAADAVGGRVRTDHIDGFLMDRGFQVLLTAYPEVNRYLDLDKLDLCYFEPGAIVYRESDPFLVTDPLKRPSTAFNALFSPVGTLGDKVRMWNLTQHVKYQDIDKIFSQPSVPTVTYLNEKGFSSKMMNYFFHPFFGGIFLENELNTSSRIFEFIFKMFSEGYAAIPKKGMQMIPDQLKNLLNNTEFLFSTKVKSFSGKKLILENGKDLPYDKLVIATHPEQVTADFREKTPDYKDTINLYFAIPKKEGKPVIGLVPMGEGLINNLCIISNVSTDYSPSDKSLLSVTVVGIPTMSEEDLIKKVRFELFSIMGLVENEIEHIKSYYIHEALPMVGEPSMTVSKNQIKIGEDIYLAGDYLLNGSLNAAMASGRYCASALISDLT